MAVRTAVIGLNHNVCVSVNGSILHSCVMAATAAHLTSLLLWESCRKGLATFHVSLYLCEDIVVKPLIKGDRRGQILHGCGASTLTIGLQRSLRNTASMLPLFKARDSCTPNKWECHLYDTLCLPSSTSDVTQALLRGTKARLMVQSILAARTAQGIGRINHV